MKYVDQLKDPRWQKKRLEILQTADFKCEECRDGESQLHIHHSFYRKGVMAWDYPDEAYHCVCQPCHQYRASVEQALLMSVAYLHFTEVDDIARAIEKYKDIGISPASDFLRAASDNWRQLDEDVAKFEKAP